MEQAAGANLLSRIGWLSQQPASFQRALLAIVNWRTIAPGEMISRASDESGGMRSGLNTAESPLGDIQLPGSWGGTGPIFRKARGADATASVESFLAFVPQPRLLRLLAANPIWWQAVGEINTDLMFRYAIGLVDMMLRNPRHRCIAVLLRLCDCRLRDNGAGMPVTIICSQDEFGDMTNLSRQAAGGILRDIERQGHIEVGYRSITLIQAAPLRAMINGG
jgi:hypothetical protein